MPARIRFHGGRRGRDDEPTVTEKIHLYSLLKMNLSGHPSGTLSFVTVSRYPKAVYHILKPREYSVVGWIFNDFSYCLISLSVLRLYSVNGRIAPAYGGVGGKRIEKGNCSSTLSTTNPAA